MHLRGRQFEAEVAKFLRPVGLEVTANAGIARPLSTLWGSFRN